MAFLEDLPDELLSLIFQHFRNDAYRNHVQRPILCWLRTCWRFYNAAIPIIYRHISIHISRISALLQLPHGTKLGHGFCVFKYTRSLTIRGIDSRWAQYQSPSRPTRDNWLQSLKELIAMTTSLTSFSFVAKRKDHGGSSSFSGPPITPLAMDGALLANALGSLPPTVISLELATPVFSWSTDEPLPFCCPLCEAIRVMLPRLHHLRIQLWNIWEGLFSLSQHFSAQGDFPLRTAVIWLSADRAKKSATLPCDYNNRSSRHVPIDVDVDVPEQLHNATLSCARELINTRNFPRLRQFVVLDKIHRGRNTVVFVKSDITAPARFGFPCEILDGQRGWQDPKYLIRVYSGFPSPSVSGNPAGYRWTDYVSTYEALINLVEGEAAWIQGPCNHSRLPRTVALRAQEELGLTFPAAEVCEDADVFRTRPESKGVTCRLWEAEGPSIEPVYGPYIPATVEILRVRENGKWVMRGIRVLPYQGIEK